MIELRNICKSYGDNKVFDGFDLDIEENHILAILGASGCGKTTLLNIISGLTDFKGEIKGAGKKVSYVFQQPRLLPNLTVFKNLEYVLKKEEKAKRKRVIEDALKKVEMWEEKDKYPSELSGGMSQRVALARAFAYEAPLLLMDEPFKGLDIALKKRIIEVFKNLYESDGRTVVFVTHDIDEAFLLADRIVVLKSGGEKTADIELDKPINERTLGDFGDLKTKMYDII